MLTIQAKVSCDEFGCVAHENVTLKVFHGEVLVMKKTSPTLLDMGFEAEAVALTQFELVETEHTHDWTVNFSGDKSYCPEHKPGHNKSGAW